MIGPSSSHTAGAVKIGQMAEQLFERLPKKVSVTFYGSFAETYKGHGTAVAIVAGILGFETHDERIPDAIEIAEKQQIQIEFLVSDQATNHANTVYLELSDAQKSLNVTGISIGGGSVELIACNQQSTICQNLQNNGLVILMNHSKQGPIELKENLAVDKITLLQEMTHERMYFIETENEVNHQLLTKLNQLPGIIKAIATSG